MFVFVTVCVTDENPATALLSSAYATGESPTKADCKNGGNTHVLTSTDLIVAVTVIGPFFDNVTSHKLAFN